MFVPSQFYPTRTSSSPLPQTNDCSSWSFRLVYGDIWEILADESLVDCRLVVEEEFQILEPTVDSNEEQGVVLAKTFHCLAFLLRRDKEP